VAQWSFSSLCKALSHSDIAAKRVLHGLPEVNCPILFLFRVANDSLFLTRNGATTPNAENNRGEAKP
jgi:hypothetical protein